MFYTFLPSWIHGLTNKSENYLISLGCDDCGADLPLEGCSASLPSLPPLFLTAKDTEDRSHKIPY